MTLLLAAQIIYALTIIPAVYLLITRGGLLSKTVMGLYITFALLYIFDVTFGVETAAIGYASWAIINAGMFCMILKK